MYTPAPSSPAPPGGGAGAQSGGGPPPRHGDGPRGLRGLERDLDRRARGEARGAHGHGHGRGPHGLREGDLWGGRGRGDSGGGNEDERTHGPRVLRAEL